MRNTISSIFLLMLILLLNGCWDMIDINQAALITGVGIDYQKDQVIYTAQFAQKVTPQEAGTGKPLTESFTAQGQTVTDAARKVLLRSPVFPLWAHTDLILIGEGLAREDLALLSDFLLRNRNLRPEAAIIVAYQDTPEKILNVPMPLSPYSATAINQLLDNNEAFEGVHVKVTMKDFLSHLVTPGIEPVVPQISLSENEKLTLNGAAVFRNRRQVGSLNEQECRGYRWLHYNINRGGLLTITSPTDKKPLSFDIANISSKIRPVFKNDKLIYEIKVNTSLNLLEQTGQGNLMTDSRRRQLEKLADQEIKRQIKLCVEKSQSLNSDILGLGLQTHRYYPEYWQDVEGDWDTFYPRLQIEIKVKSQILSGYLLKESVDLES